MHFRPVLACSIALVRSVPVEPEARLVAECIAAELEQLVVLLQLAVAEACKPAGSHKLEARKLRRFAAATSHSR